MAGTTVADVIVILGTPRAAIVATVQSGMAADAKGAAALRRATSTIANRARRTLIVELPGVRVQTDARVSEATRVLIS